MPAHTRRTAALILTTALAALPLAGCATSTAEQAPASASSPAVVSPSQSSSATTGLDPALFDNASIQVMPGVTVTNATVPIITVTPGTAAPSEEVTAVLLGAPDGAPAVTSPSDVVRVNYVGAGLSTGKVFDSSYNRGEPVGFALNQVIPGWTQGLAGAKAGQRVALVIPADLAYGATPPQGSGIEAGEALVFVVDVLDVAQAG